jgi:hypothetical protein
MVVRALVAGLVGGLVGLLAGEARGLVPYDDFSGTRLDPRKWGSLEVARRIENGRLLLEVAASGADQSLSLDVRDPMAVTTISAEVSVRSAVSQAGRGVAARVEMSLYNDGTGSLGAQGDVAARVDLHFEQGRLEIRTLVLRFGDAEANARNVFVATQRTVGPASFGEPHTLGLGWDGRLVTFTVDGATDRVDPMALIPMGRPTPNDRFARLRARVEGPVVDPSALGAISAAFANVRVNGAPYDDFSGSTIDQAKWQEAESDTRIANGALVASATAQGTNRSRYLQFKDQDEVSAVAARVRVDALASDGASATAALAGYFYNDGSPGEGASGNVQAGVRLAGASPTAPLSISWFVVRCDDALCSRLTTLRTGTLGSAPLGQFVTLAIEWDGALFTFRADQAAVTYDPRGQAPPRGTRLRGPLKVMGLAIFAASSPTARASIVATFDDVQVALTPPPPVTRPVLAEPADSATLSLAGPRRLVLRWQPVDGATAYAIEHTGPGRAFANPNGTGPDPSNGFGGAGGALLVANGLTNAYLILPEGVPPGLYQWRVIGLDHAFRPIGSFSDAGRLTFAP